MFSAIHDIDPTIRVDFHPPESHDLAVSKALGAEGVQVGPISFEDGESPVSRVCDQVAVIGEEANHAWMPELTNTIPRLTQCEKRRVIRVENVHQ